jgi:HSP20 family protein
MPILRWRPPHDIDEIVEEASLNPFHNNGWDLAVDVLEDEKHIIVYMNIPGIDPHKIDIEIEDSHMRISGSREEEKTVEDQQYYNKEIRRGIFERIIQLPTFVQGGQAKATFNQGVLKIILPKVEGKKPPQKIKVSQS